MLRVVPLLVAGLWPFAAVGNDEQTLTLGIHPYLSHSNLHVRFTPLARLLSEQLGMPVAVRIGRDYEEHIREIGADRLDIAYLGPVSYVRMTGTFGSKPLLARLQRKGESLLGGHIVVADRSPIAQMSELKGKVFAFGDPASTMSSVVPQAYLKQAGVETADLAYAMRLRGHTNVALAVLTGQADAGAVKSEVFEEFRARGLRSLSALPRVSEHLFVAAADMPEGLVERIRSILLSAHQSAEGRFALRAIHDDATRLTAVADADYDGLRDILRLLDE